MSENFWKKVSHYTGLLLAAPLFGFIVLLTNIEIKDLDLWLHLKTGAFIVQHHFVPSVDVLSCTIAGKPWINHEWLFQVIAHLVDKFWGTGGLIDMQVIVVALTFLILLLLCYNPEKQLATILLLTLVLLVYQSRFTIRPDIFSLLFLVMDLGIVAYHLEKRWSLYALIVIQILWVNMHGFFFFGPLILTLAFISEWLKRRIPLPYNWNEAGRLTDGEYSFLKKVIPLVLLACLLNPHTVKGALYPLGVLFQISGDSKVFFKYIQELQKPILPDTIFSVTHYLHYKLLILVSAISFILNRRRIDIGDLMLWAIFLMFSLTAIRNMVFFAVIACMVSAANISGMSLENITPFRFQQKKFHHLSAIILKLFFIVWLLDYAHKDSMNGYFDFDRYERKSEFRGISQRNYPDKAVDFLVKNHVKGNFFNDFNSGAYLIGHCYPDIKVFIDGRTEVYGAKFFEYYRKIWNEGDARLFDEAAKKYHLTGAFLNSVNTAIAGDLLRHLYHSKEWSLVYFDYDAVIFLKNVPQNARIIQEHLLDLSHWQVPQVDLGRLGTIRVTPYRCINRAYTLESLGFYDAVLAECAQALKVSPDYAEAYKLMAKIEAQRKEYKKSFEDFRIAAMLVPGNIETRNNLAMAYENLNDWAGAIGQYKRVIGIAPKDAAGYFRLSRAYLKSGNYSDAAKVLKTAAQMDPGDTVDIIKIADLFSEKKQYKAAQEAYETVLRSDSKSVEAYLKLSQMLKASGKLKEATAVLKKGLAANPNNAKLKTELEAPDAQKQFTKTELKNK